MDVPGYVISRFAGNERLFLHHKTRKLKFPVCTKVNRIGSFFRKPEILVVLLQNSFVSCMILQCHMWTMLCTVLVSSARHKHPLSSRLAQGIQQLGPGTFQQNLLNDCSFKTAAQGSWGQGNHTYSQIQFNRLLHSQDLLWMLLIMKMEGSTALGPTWPLSLDVPLRRIGSVMWVGRRQASPSSGLDPAHHLPPVLQQYAVFLNGQCAVRHFSEILFHLGAQESDPLNWRGMSPLSQRLPAAAVAPKSLRKCVSAAIYCLPSGKHVTCLLEEKALPGRFSN